MANGDKKQPWFKFYPSDWAGDRKLHMCSIAARGLWADLLCVMHEAEPYGHLVTDGHAVTNRQIAALAGITLPECGKLMAELESAGVYSRASDKTIFSRRMVRDKAKAEKDRKNGKDGGNPNLISPDNRGVNPPDKAQIPEARIDDAVTRAGASLISPEAFEIADAIEKACGYDLPEEIPPGWCGGAMWVQKCLNDGWIGAVMIDAARGVARRAKSPIMGFKYLEKPLAQAMAEHRAPLPQVEVRQPEKLTVIANGTTKPGSLIAAIDRQLASLEAEASADFALPESSIQRISR